MTLDHLAFIGRNPMDRENVFIVTGDSGMGLTHGTIAAMINSDLILGRENRWAKLYRPSRKPVGAVPTRIGHVLPSLIWARSITSHSRMLKARGPTAATIPDARAPAR